MVQKQVVFRHEDIDSPDKLPSDLRPVLLCMDSNNNYVVVRTRGAESPHAPAATKPAGRARAKKDEDKDHAHAHKSARAAPVEDAAPVKASRPKKAAATPAPPAAAAAPDTAVSAAPGKSRRRAAPKSPVASTSSSPSSSSDSASESDDDAPALKTAVDILADAILSFKKKVAKDPADACAKSLEQLESMANGTVYGAADIEHRLRFLRGDKGGPQPRFVDPGTGKLTPAAVAAIERVLHK